MVSENFNAKTARACDSCIRKRARWYCASDDAFLCQACDALVHTANRLTRRHQRVRLKTASVKQLSLELPSWHSGFTKKPRTTRHGNHHRQTNSDNVRRNPLHLVPEMGPDENWYEENEEQAKLVYRVPIFDPFAAELCLSGNSSEGAINDDKYRIGMLGGSGNYDGNISMHGLYSSNMDLEDFAADVENLLGKGLDDEESFDMETLGFLHFAEKLDSMELTSSKSTENVKLEEEEMEGNMGNYRIDAEINMNRETFELNFDDYDEYPANYEENADKAGVGVSGVILKKEEYCDMGNVKHKEKKKILLALDYEGVIAAWADQKSAWTTGQRLDLDTNDCWPDCMAGCGRVQYYPTYGGMGGSSIGVMLDGSAGREARVSRYREKRRTRLFSKKIRYEVRKLNAEKRPRLKGRFVKPPNFAAAGTSFA